MSNMCLRRYLMVKVYEAGEVYFDGKTPVPSYDEYCNLVFQANKPKNPLSDVMMCYDTEREKKVVERLKEQLKEANDCINSAQISLRGYMLKINEYKKKWGVK